MKRVNVIRRGSTQPLASRFSKRSGSRESIRPVVRQMCLKHRSLVKPYAPSDNQNQRKISLEQEAAIKQSLRQNFYGGEPILFSPNKFKPVVN